MRKIVITGATGFIGYHIAEHALRNKYSVKIISRRYTPDLHTLESLGAAVFYGQLDNMEFLNGIIGKNDIVIHCAGATKAVREDEMIKANILCTEFLLRACESKNVKFIFLSSQAVGGPSSGTDHFIDENDCPNPLTWYGRSKYQAEKAVKAWGEKNLNSYLIIRASSVFGPREKDFLQYFKLISHNIALIMGMKEKYLSIIFVNDLVNGIFFLIEQKNLKQKTYYLCGDETISWNNFATQIKQSMEKNVLKIKLPEFAAYPVAVVSELISRISGKPALINFQKIIEMKQSYWLCSNRLIKSLGWAPEFNLKNGILLTLEWYQKKNWL